MKTIFLSLSFLLSLGCQNPEKSIEHDIENFKTDHADQFANYTTIHRTMRFAWAGDPTKQPVIFVHGSPGSWQAWAGFLMNTELQKRFHLIAVDRPGYGGSTAGVTEPSLVNQASDIIDVLKFNKSNQPAILIGHSYGGPVIARMAMDYPEKIAGLIFVASSVDPDLEKTKWFQYPATYWPIKYLIPKSIKVCNEEIMQLKPELQKLISLWPQIKAKVILIQGDDDDLVPKENLNFLKAHIAKDQIVHTELIPQMNHFIPWRRPDLILQGLNLLVP